MKKILHILGVVAITALLLCVPAARAEAAPNVTITFLNPPDRILELEVGQPYTFDVQIISDEPFVMAMLMTDQYYPGRSIHWQGCDVANQATSAVLHLTITGKASTADLPGVCDWPEANTCWEEGVAPMSLVVGARYRGGQMVSERFDFAVVVP
jgi:hypothetical protein